MIAQLSQSTKSPSTSTGTLVFGFQGSSVSTFARASPRLTSTSSSAIPSSNAAPASAFGDRPAL